MAILYFKGFNGLFLLIDYVLFMRILCIEIYLYMYTHAMMMICEINEVIMV